MSDRRPQQTYSEMLQEYDLELRQICARSDESIEATIEAYNQAVHNILRGRGLRGSPPPSTASPILTPTAPASPPTTAVPAPPAAAIVVPMTVVVAPSPAVVVVAPAPADIVEPTPAGIVEPTPTAIVLHQRAAIVPRQRAAIVPRRRAAIAPRRRTTVAPRQRAPIGYADPSFSGWYTVTVGLQTGIYPGPWYVSIYSLVSNFNRLLIQAQYLILRLRSAWCRVDRPSGFY